MLKNVTPTELYEAIQRIGSAVAAAQGYFHALPYGSGGGELVGNVRMYRGKSLTVPGMNRSRIEFELTGFDSPLVEPPFAMMNVLNPVVDYEYDVSVEKIDYASQVLTVMLRWYWVGDGVDPDTGGNVDVGLRVEPFVVS